MPRWAGRGISPAEAARDAGISWHCTHVAFGEAADRVLGRQPAQVAHLGIDEHRRGRPRWRTDDLTGETVQLADRWHVCFYDLDGNQGMLGQVEGRTADDAAYWLAGATPGVGGRRPGRRHRHVRGLHIRRPPHAASSSHRRDLFHVVQLAVKTTGDVRRRAIRERYGRRGKADDPEYGIKSLLNRNLENLSREQFGKIIETLDASPQGQQVALTWIAKEKLRDALKLRARHTGSTPCERQVRNRLFTFYDWCAQREGIPELQTLANTIARWGKRDRDGSDHRRHQRHRRKPQPPRQTRSPPRLGLPQPRKPAPPRPHRLHTQHPTQTTSTTQGVTRRQHHHG